jgi:hypothetical protein
VGIPVLILGDSGSGKSSSLRNFKPEELGIFNVAGKPLPFRNALPTLQNARYDSIIKMLSKPSKKVYVVDDAQYLMVFEAFAKAKETGYGKFTDMALNYYGLIQFVIQNTPPDVIVYFLQHTERDENGRLHAKTLGKMLDTQLTVEGLFSIVLHCQTDGVRHFFATQSDGNSTAKSPMGMFEREIDNDLKMVDTTIREYWGLNENAGNEE